LIWKEKLVLFLDEKRHILMPVVIYQHNFILFYFI